MGLLRKILRIEKPKPATQEELNQLKLELQKQEIKSQIAKLKSSGPSVFDSIKKVIGTSNNNPFDFSSSSKESRSIF